MKISVNEADVIMTERLYERDSYCREFNATVLSCNYNNGFYDVVLDRTAFFPEGGGQAADNGKIAGNAVFDVQLINDVIIHKTKAELQVGDNVECAVDWQTRFTRMQSHAGEHIVSGIIHSMYNYSNVGFHMGSASMTLDVNGPLSKEDISLIELRANEAVYHNYSITDLYPTKEELEKIEYRSKIEISGQVRLIKIENTDCCACCAPHPSRTGEIGIIKIIDFFPYKKGTRIEMVAGINAFKDFCMIHSANKEIMGLLSAERDKTVEAVEKQGDIIRELRDEKEKLARKLALYKLEPSVINDSVYAFSSDLSYDDLRYCANYHLQAGKLNCVFFSKNEDNYIYVISGEPDKVKAVVDNVNRAFNGKGGGKPGYAQGKITTDDTDKVVAVLKSLL